MKNKEDLIIIRDLATLQALRQYLSDKDLVSYDVETDGVDKESHVIGLSVCADLDKAYYVILSGWDKTQQKLVEILPSKAITPLLQDLTTKNLVMHNAIFDCWMTKNNFNVDLLPALHTDTMVLAHLLDEERPKGLKDLGVLIFGDDAKAEQLAMKESVQANGGSLTKDKYELFKADPELIAFYGAKDALLTHKLFYHFIPQLYDEGLDKFFYEEESMPLLKGPSYDLNTRGLRVDPSALQKLKMTLEAEILELKSYILKEIEGYIYPEYDNKTPKTTFNLNSGSQMGWLLYHRLGEDYGLLTDGGKDVCKALNLKLPYTVGARRDFVSAVKDRKGETYAIVKGKEKKLKNYWDYMKTGVKDIPPKLIEKYKWLQKFYELKKLEKLLGTYVEGIQSRMKYNVIRPTFLQCGTTSGRYSSRNPNFQNLPRTEKRVKECIVSRPGMVFIGADYSQLEPRVFASLSGDQRLLDCFESGEDFYSVIGMEVFEKFDCSPIKDHEDSFAKKYGALRDKSKVIALSSVYGTTANKLAGPLGAPVDEAQATIDGYFEKFPGVARFMTDAHEEAKATGRSMSMFGRPRRLPKAKDIPAIYKNTAHAALPYEARTLLNLAVNHKCQSAGASIINRAAIRFMELIKEANIKDAYLVMNVHDELVVECREEDAEDVAALLKYAMEETTHLPGVKLEAIPVIAKNLKDLK